MDFSFLPPKGIQKFKGQYFHSRQYKHPEGFERKRILVIGIGNSASDIAVELSKKAAQVRCSLITLYGGGEENPSHVTKAPMLINWLIRCLVAQCGIIENLEIKKPEFISQLCH